jgi:hypothetical protein
VNQNVATTVFKDILHAQLGLSYTNTRKSLGAVDHEKGLRWDLAASSDHANSETFNKVGVGLDFGLALPWKHSSLWFYNAAGSASGNKVNPLASFYFGGFKNNYVDDNEVKRYREPYSMPGFEIDALNGRSFFKSVVELNLPPKRFRAFGSPGLFASWLRPAFFVAGLWTDPSVGENRDFTSAGFQLDVDFTVGHRHSMTLSAGFAAGFEDGDRQDDEIMFSLKIL